jgi:hypothetical protein
VLFLVTCAVSAVTPGMWLFWAGSAISVGILCVGARRNQLANIRTAAGLNREAQNTRKGGSV